MRQKIVGLIVAGMIMIWAVAGFAQTDLTVVRHSDNTLWAMTCDGITNCSAWIKIGGGFSQQPTLMWQPTIQKYILVGESSMRRLFSHFTALCLSEETGWSPTRPSDWALPTVH